MKKILSIAALAAVVCTTSCKKDDYITGGSLHNPKVDMTTVDYLRQNPLFDTLCLLIDKAGVEAAINESGISFFAPTDYYFKDYLTRRNSAAQGQSATKKYTIDTLIKYDLQGFRDSINIHVVQRQLPYSDLGEERQTFATAFAGISADVSYREVKKEEYGYNPATGIYPRIVYYRIGTMETYCQTSGIVTNTGMLFVLQNPGGYESGSPTLYFRKN